MQTTFDILSTPALRDNSEWRANKIGHGEGENAHLNFRSISKK